MPVYTPPFHRLCLSFLLICCAWPVSAAPQAKAIDPVQRPALKAVHASHAVMLAVSTAGKRLIAAGERGIVLLSDDNGQSWQQADVPVSTTLTSLSFPTPLMGWAAGHAGVILHTQDGGKTWTKQLDGSLAAKIEAEAAQQSGDAARMANAERLVADGPDKPFLGVHFWNPSQGFAVGAYGLAMGTEDGGKTWQPWFDRIDNPKGLHLNALFADGATVILVGEQGLLLRSTDKGQRFKPLASPYAGSWFTVTGKGPQLVLAGLRGNVFWSDDNGDHWRASQVPVPVSITASVTTADARHVFVNQAGIVLVSDDGGKTLRVGGRSPGAPYTALGIAPDGSVLAGSFAGAMKFPVPRQSP